MRAMKESQIVVVGGQEIQSCILMLRGVQVMLDRDLAHLYGVTTSALNQAVKRNRSRFPERFMFQMTASELENWKSQNVMSNSDDAALRMGLRRPPFAFTEHGVTMLASVLKSETAVRVSLSIIDAFVAMRRFLMANADVFRRIETVERKQIVDQAKNEERFQRVFAALDEKKDVNQGVFFDGQLWDACSLAEKLVARAKKSIVLIDNWIGPGTLDILAKKRKGVAVRIVSSARGNKLAESDVAKFNEQYPSLTVTTSAAFHDRFLILDENEIYLIGASFKDLGKKCFAFAKLDTANVAAILAKI